MSCSGVSGVSCVHLGLVEKTTENTVAVDESGRSPGSDQGRTSSLRPTGTIVESFRAIWSLGRQFRLTLFWVNLCPSIRGGWEFRVSGMSVMSPPAKNGICRVECSLADSWVEEREFDVRF